jgi:hypothetical protein
MNTSRTTIFARVSNLGAVVALGFSLAGCSAPSDHALNASASLSGPVAIAAHISPAGVPGGAFLPNHARTPGAVNPAVTQANIHRTICVRGWTATVRPSSSLTTALKVKQLATGYAYHGDRVKGHYEEDHLISLELGGAPAAAANLWPEPYASAEGARVKDRVENKLHALVCAGTLRLSVAQHVIASNWWAAYKTYVG